MDLPQLIALGGKDPELRFLIIGGYAVMAHGYQRATFDIDFLSSIEDRSEWTPRLTDAGLELLRENKNFTQFKNPSGADLDMMFVASESFEKMWPERKTLAIDGSDAHVVSLKHLLALKLHVLKQQPTHRTFKDAQDVEHLVRRNGIDLSSPEYEEWFLKYGSREIYETIRRIVRRPG
ncbi:MAG: hypothetical protein CMO80_11525 [Verrucomicrobiales bacterium]|nr:hypothetical protein [Verrucomicrobiales bacterium]|tara:strand:+ start:88 stop:621 length:534 start_codon:yes stop_codon:yes gene_type:complete